MAPFTFFPSCYSEFSNIIFVQCIVSIFIISIKGNYENSAYSITIIYNNYNFFFFNIKLSMQKNQKKKKKIMIWQAMTHRFLN